MPLVVPRYTLQDLESFPDDGSRYELLDGALLVTPAPAPLHQLVVSRICGALTKHLAPASLARAFAPGVVELEPNVHPEPDISASVASSCPALPVRTCGTRTGCCGIRPRWASR